MSKRAREEETKEERWMRKFKKYEHKLEAKRVRRIIYSDEESDEKIEEHPEYDLEIPIEYPNEEAMIIDKDDLIKSINVNTTPCEVPIESDEELNHYDPTLLQALGETEPDAMEFGDNLQTDLAKQFEKFLACGLKKEVKDELLKKYLTPKNLALAKSPELNPEIGGMLAEVCKVRDKRLVTKQNQLGKSLSALGKAITGLLKKDPDIPEIIRILNDTGKLLADSHYTETDTRRSVIIPLIDKSLADPFKERKRDNFLFGDNLGDLVKNSRGIKRTSQMIQASPSTSGLNLNGKGPSIRPRQMRSNVSHQYRSGGPRTSYPNRRRGFAPPPPPPPPPQQRYFRRQPQLPPVPPPMRRQPAPASTQRPPAHRTT